MVTAMRGARARRGAAAAGTAAPTLAVVLDHAHARFFLVTDAATVEIEDLSSRRMRGGKFHSDRQDSPGWGERGFHQRRREEERRHYAAVGRRLGALVRAHGAQALVLGGSEPVVAALTRALPPLLVGMVTGTPRLNPVELTVAAVHRAAQAAHKTHVLAAETTLVGSWQEALGAERAVDGLRAVLLALGHDQIRTLLVAPGYRRSGYRCAGSGRLVLDKAEAKDEAVVLVPDLVAAAAAETRRCGGEVVEITEPRLAERLDGIAALLRYR
jgi:stalled ribosome rescue protein Dom34